MFFKSVSFYIILVLLGLAVGAGWLYKEELEAHANTQSKLAQLESQVEKVKAQYELEKKNHTSLREVKQTAAKEFREIKGALDGLKDRQETIKKKPGLVELKIKRSFDQYMTELQCETGAPEKCLKP